jgi:hypothetical protein
MTQKTLSPFCEIKITVSDNGDIFVDTRNGRKGTWFKPHSCVHTKTEVVKHVTELLTALNIE